MRLLARRTFLEAAGALAGSALFAACTAGRTPATAPRRLGVLGAADGGDDAAAGQSLQRGLALALATVEAGRPPPEIVRFDGAGGCHLDDEQVAGEAAAFVRERQIDVLAGIADDGGRECWPRLARALGVPLLATDARGSAPLLGGANDVAASPLFGNPYAFWLGPVVQQLARPLGEWAYRELGLRACICAADDAWGRAAANAFRDGFTRGRGTVAAEEYLPAEATDYAPALAAVEPQRAEIVFAALRGDAAVRFARQYAALGLPRRARLVGIGELFAPWALAAAGHAALGAVGCLPWLPALDLPANIAFVARYGARYDGAEPDALAVQGYDAGLLVAAALQRTGEASDHASLAAAIASASIASPRGPLRFDPTTHGVVQDVYVADVKEQRGTLRPVVLERIAGVRPGA